MLEFETLKKMLSEIGYKLEKVTETPGKMLKDILADPKIGKGHPRRCSFNDVEGYVVTDLSGGGLVFPSLKSVFDHFYPNG